MAKERKILKLDYYVVPPVRLYILIFGMLLIFHSFLTNESYLTFNLLIIKTFQLCAGLTISGIGFLRKTLVFENKYLYNTLTLFDKVIFKKEIDTNLWSIGSVKRLDKTTGNWWAWEFRLRLFREYNGFSIYLHNEVKNLNVRLVSLLDADKLNEAIEFIQSNTGIKFPKADYRNHW